MNGVFTSGLPSSSRPGMACGAVPLISDCSLVGLTDLDLDEGRLIMLRQRTRQANGDHTIDNNIDWGMQSSTIKTVTTVGLSLIRTNEVGLVSA